TTHKLIAEVACRARAMQIASAMEDLLATPPDALTVSETTRVAGGDGATAAGPSSWLIEAYFSEPPAPQDLSAELASLLGEPVPEPFRSADIPDLNWVALSQAALPPV